MEILCMLPKKDNKPKVVEVPEDFAKLIKKHPEVEKTFYSMPYSHKKEYIRWIEDAKREETRKRRMQKSIEMMRDKTNNL